MKFLLIVLFFLSTYYSTRSEVFKKIYSETVILNSTIESDNNSISLVTPSSLNTSLTFILPSSVPSGTYVMSGLGNGALTFISLSSLGSISGTDGEIQFNNNGDFDGDQDLFWDNSNNRLGVGTSTPEYSLDITGNLKIIDGELILYSEQPTNDYQIIFQLSDDQTQTNEFSWPNDDGSPDNIIVTNGTGSLNWVDDNVLIVQCSGEGQATGSSTGNSANGTYAFVAGGTNNTANGNNSFIGSGQNNNVSGDFSVIVAGESNTITERSDFAMIGAGQNNYIDGSFSVILAGTDNRIEGNSQYAFIGAARNSTIESDYAFIGGGQDNEIGTNSDRSIIGGGRGNSIDQAYDSGILGGQDNSISSGSFSSIGGGRGNQTEGNYSFIGSGRNNYISGNRSAIVGGESNTIDGANNATIMGGENNEITANRGFIIGNDSQISASRAKVFGRNANITNSGACLIVDGTATTLNSESNHQMLAMMSGGYLFYTDEDLSNNVNMDSGDNSWSGVSDSTKKENFLALNQNEYLSKINQLQLYSWSYKGFTLRNYGPMAQGFYRLFGNDGIGTIGNDTTISAHNLSSIAILGVQALKNKNKELSQQIEELSKLNEIKKAKIKKLRNALKAIEDKKRVGTNK